MTMAQGELFNGDEESTGLSAFASDEQSQSKEAKYHRAYRSDPKNKDRINSQKKRRRALKKEKELGSVSSMFESAAHPIKEEPQTVENSVSHSDTGSLSKPDGEASSKSDPNEAIIRVLEQGFRRLENNFDSLQSEIRCLKENVKPTAPALPIDIKTEQQAISESVKIANSENLTKTFNGEKKKTIAKRIIEKLPTLGMSLLIISLLGFNTFFLVAEQASLYESMSYSAGMALMIAILSEASLISLSAMASWTCNLEWKIGLTTGMLALMFVMVGVLDSSAKNRSNTAAKQSQEARNIEKQLTTLRALEAPILAQIKSLDPEVYPTKISRLSSQLTAPPEGYSYQIKQLSKILASISIAEADTGKLIWQRRVILLINLILSGFLGFLWSKKQESVLTKFGRSMSHYWQRTCEA